MIPDHAGDFTASHPHHVKNDKSKREKRFQRKAFSQDWETDGTVFLIAFKNNFF